MNEELNTIIKNNKKSSFNKFEIYFKIEKEFFFGDGNDPDQYEKNRSNFVEPLYQPNLTIDDGYCSLKDVIGNENELLKYYEDVLIKSKKYDVESIGVYFWMNLFIISDNRVIGFPWYDFYQEFKAVFDSFSENDNEIVFEDVEEGWAIRVFQDDTKYYFYQYDFDNPDDQESWVLIISNKNEFIDKMHYIKEDAEEIISYMLKNFETKSDLFPHQV